MISKKHRLSRSDFILAKKNGKNYSTSHFTAVVSASDIIRFSVVTSGKLAKSAVVRNRLRRQIYDSLQATSYKLKARLIVYPKPSMINLSRAEISSELNSFISTLHS